MSTTLSCGCLFQYPSDMCKCGIFFDALYVRAMRSSYMPITTPYSDEDPLQKRIHAYLDDDDGESALMFIEAVIEKIKAHSPWVMLLPDQRPVFRNLHHALLLRSKIHLKLNDLDKAKSDAEIAIVFKPSYVHAFGWLSDIEIQRGQLGRAEVALRLGLVVDPGNAVLKQNLSALRNRDKIVQDPVTQTGYAGHISQQQKKAIHEIFLKPRSNVVKYILKGDIFGLTAEWKPEMRDMKVGRLKAPLIHLPIYRLYKLQVMEENSEEAQKESTWGVAKAMVDLLFDYGIRVNTQDRFGFTALMFASACSYHLVEHLLKKGADPNIATCLGHVALTEATRQGCSSFVEVFLKCGADPDIADNEGVSPRMLAGVAGESLPDMKKVYEPYLNPDSKSKSAYECRKCGTIPAKSSAKRCSKCRVCFYCSRRCQEDDWAEHKKGCRAVFKSLRRLAIADHSSRSDREKMEKYHSLYNEQCQKNGNMTLRISAVQLIESLEDIKAPGDRTLVDPDSEMIAVTEDKKFRCYVDPKKLDGQDVLYQIRTNGRRLLDLYFWAFVEPGKLEIIVVTDPVHYLIW